ncbi:homeobox-containing protein [Cryptosporidium felis]|nr:homeobox-containing protein [Cryptosporidium felis]
MSEVEGAYHGQIIIDGETEFDDLLLASKFAELEHFKSASIWTEVDSSSDKRQLHGRETESVDIILSEDEFNRSDDNYESSGNEDNEIKELIRKEMKSRQKTPNFKEGKREGFEGKLSDEYLTQFGMVLNKGKGGKDELSDITEVENEIAGSEEENNSTRSGRPAKDGVSEQLSEEKQSWLPNIEILDMPERVDGSLPCEFVGEIYSAISDGAIYGMEGIFIVKSDPSSLMLDLGSVLCLEDKKIVGAIIDTFGPISSPFYVLSKRDNVESDLLKTGTRIYCDRRHSTILGKAGKIKYGYLSSTSSEKKSTNSATNSSGGIPKNGSKSPFSNKDFKKDPKPKASGKTQPGEVEEDEDNESQEESGDDIGTALKCPFPKKFVERYEDLGLIQESAVEDSSQALNPKVQESQIHSRRQSGNNRNPKRPPNQNSHSSGGRFSNARNSPHGRPRPNNGHAQRLEGGGGQMFQVSPPQYGNLVYPGGNPGYPQDQFGNQNLYQIQNHPQHVGKDYLYGNMNFYGASSNNYHYSYLPGNPQFCPQGGPMHLQRSQLSYADLGPDSTFPAESPQDASGSSLNSNRLFFPVRRDLQEPSFNGASTAGYVPNPLDQANQGGSTPGNPHFPYQAWEKSQ